MTNPDRPALPIRPEIAALPDYNAGLAMDRFRAIYGIDCQAKLDSNENPLGPSPAAIAAIRDMAAGVARYPDAANAALRARIAAHCGTGADRVIIGNGSEDLIGALYRAVLRPGDRVVTICPSFGLHEFGALACGAVVEKVPFAADWSFPVAGLAAAMAGGARVLILSSPSNPAGPVIARADFAALLEATPPETLICFDEAYVEYIAPERRFDALAMLAARPNPWISLRTFSKAYGLAGARVGYGLASDPGLVGALMKTRNPFGVNALAGAAAAAALEDGAHLAKVVALASEERARLAAGIAALGLAVAPSEANFLFFQCPGPAAALAEGLRHRGVLVKAWQEEPFRDWARVTLGAPAENAAFLTALTAELETPKTA